MTTQTEVPTDGKWYWVRYEGLGKTYEAPALYKENAKEFYSVEFSGIPAHQVEVISEYKKPEQEPLAKCAQCKKEYRHGKIGVGCPKCAPNVDIPESEFQKPITPPQRKPLTDDEIWKNDGIMSANSGYGATFETLREVVRATEAAHGIKGDA